MEAMQKKFTRSPKTLARLLDRMKWGDLFRCTKCGGQRYMKGKKALSRRCMDCKYEESLYKNTAFEDLRLPLTKAVAILEEIFHRSPIRGDMRIIPKGKDVLSITKFIKQETQKSVHPGKIDDVIYKHVYRNRPSVRELANTYGIEANSVTKFLKKVDERIPAYKTSLFGTPLQRITEHMCHYQDKGIGNFLGMLMVSTPGNWHYGIRYIDDIPFGITDSLNDMWRIHVIHENGQPDVNDPIEYGCDEWFDLFCLPRPQRSAKQELSRAESVSSPSAEELNEYVQSLDKYYDDKELDLHLDE